MVSYFMVSYFILLPASVLLSSPVAVYPEFIEGHYSAFGSLISCSCIVNRQSWM